jgi:pectate lyase
MVALAVTPASAATLFSDDFEQPSGNVWQTGGGGSWSVVSEDGSRVFRQSNTAVDTVAWAGAGSGPFTVVTATVKPNTGSGIVALLSKVANPNNFYYVALRSGQLVIGRRSLGTTSSLASVAYPVTTGTWYTLTLNLFFTGTIRGSAVTAGGSTVTVVANDPGGTNFGGAVGFWTLNAAASFDNILLFDDRIVPTTTSRSPTPSASCAVAVTFTVPAQWPGYFQGNIALRNITSATIPAGWVLTFRLVNGEIITNMFPGVTWRQVADLITVTGPPWGPIGPGASFNVGFIASAPGGPRGISDVTFNGVRC